MINRQSSIPVSKTAVLLVLIAMMPIITSAQVYKVISFDRKGDGSDPSLADAAQLSYRYDKDQDLLWFRNSPLWRSE
jgi:hypothetical protein